jgi:hypothetical protein
MSVFLQGSPLLPAAGQAPASASASRAQPSRRLRRAVELALPDLGGLRWEALPGGRVNRVWQVGPAVVKRIGPGGAAPLFPNSAGVEVRALTAAAEAGLAPALLGAGAGWIATLAIAAQPWAGEDPPAVARLLARVGRMPPAGLPARAAGSAAILAEAAAMAPGLPPPPDPGLPGPALPVPIHGDPVPGNILNGAGRLWLVDWPCAGLGDPAADMALFLSPAMQRLYRGAALPEGAARAFLAAWPDPAAVARYRALAAVLHHRIAAHCAWRAARGAADYAAVIAEEAAFSPPAP